MLSVTDEDTVKRYFAKFEEKFFQTCEKELAKINTFYSGEWLFGTTGKMISAAKGGETLTMSLFNF